MQTKTSRFTDSQILEALKRAEAGLRGGRCCAGSWASVLRRLVSGGGMNAPMMSRMRELEAENARLRKMYIEEMDCLGGTAKLF
ncbi:transposase [Pandoraea iniqua]|uniref:transposase n=1 Tax=Pandoraea iniqua TaxID=2508288 RepID=UPI0034646CBD